jgi:MFS family permease
LRAFISDRLGNRWPIFYGWWIVAAALVGSAVISGVSFWTFTVYIPPLEEEFGWSRAEVSAAFSLSLLVGGLAGPFAGLTVDRYGARSSIAIACVLTAGSLVLLSQIQNLWQFYSVYMLHALVRTWMFFIPIQWLLTRWFVRRRGMALGLSTAGLGVGGAVFLPLVNFFIETWGWRASFEISAVIIAVTFIPMALVVLRDNPQEMGLVPDGVEGRAPTGVAPAFHGPRRDWSLGDVVRSSAFWLLAVAFTLFFMAQTSILVHIVPYLKDAGISSGAAAALVSLSAIVRTVVRVAIGVAVDRIADLRRVAMLVVLAQAAGVLLLSLSAHPLALVLFAVTWGAGGGAAPVLEIMVLSRTFGLQNFGLILGTLMLVETAGDISGPVIGGAIFDATGGYMEAFLLYVAIYLVSCVGFYFSSRGARRDAAAQEVPPTISPSPDHRRG